MDKRELEEQREKLSLAIIKNDDLNSHEILAISEELDKLINIYMKKIQNKEPEHEKNI